MKPNIPQSATGSEVVIKRDKGVTFVYCIPDYKFKPKKPKIKK